MGKESSGWTNVSSPTKVKKKIVASRKQSAEDVTKFLSTFKTTRCTNEKHHDFRHCMQYHEHDRRRNPYVTFYLPDDQDLQSSIEKLFHPQMYRTSKCPLVDNSRHGGRCPYGRRFCSYAHDQSEVRNKDQVQHEYLAKMATVEKRQLPLLRSYVGDRKSTNVPSMWNTKAKVGSVRTASTAAANQVMSSTEIFIEIEKESRHWFMINKSAEFWNFLQALAFEEGLCRLERKDDPWRQESGFVIRGLEVHIGSVISKIAHYLHKEPSEFFEIQSKKYNKGIINKLKSKLNSEDHESERLVLHPQAFIEVEDQEQLSIWAVNGRGNSGCHIVSMVLGKIEFWLKQEGYEKYIAFDCWCCRDSFTKDKGVQCSKGHFCCGGQEGCVSTLVEEQLPRLQHQKGKVVCAICKIPYDSQELAKFVTREVWESLEDARVEIKAKSRIERLSNEFDRRLEDKVNEFVNGYASVEGKIKIDAKRLAKKAQDDVLNLKCPHCKQPYAEFTGCMAIVCGTCKKSFCGYCHKDFETSKGAHMHVRECLLNETANGSYYADEETIKVAQRRYRTRELKRFLQPLTKILQNATILELEKDLEYHRIPKEALFEFGNLQDVMEQP